MTRDSTPYELDLTNEEEQRRRQRARLRQSHVRQCQNDPGAMKKAQIDSAISIVLMVSMVGAVMIAWFMLLPLPTLKKGDPRID